MVLSLDAYYLIQTCYVILKAAIHRIRPEHIEDSDHVPVSLRWSKHASTLSGDSLAWQVMNDVRHNHIEVGRAYFSRGSNQNWLYLSRSQLF